MKFRRASRLTTGPQFSKVREKGRVVQGRFLRVAFYSLGTKDPAKVGIITSKRVGGAVVRNKVRRRLREIARHSLPGIACGLWIVIVAKPSAAGAAFEDLRGEWLLLAGRLSILPPLS